MEIQKMNEEDERRLRCNWIFLKQELNVNDFVNRFVELGVFTFQQRDEINNVQTKTHLMKAEKFLEAVVQCGDRGYQTLCNILRENTDNRYSHVIDKLGITTVIINHDTMDNRPESGRPSSNTSNTSSSTRSLPSRDGETGERNIKLGHSARRAWRPESSASDVSEFSNTVSSANNSNNNGDNRSTYSDSCNSTYSGNITAYSKHNTTNNNNVSIRQNYQPDGAEGTTGQYSRSSSSGEFVHEDGSSIASNFEKVKANGMSSVAQNLEKARAKVTSGGEVDMQALEQELVRIAPTIAELFQKITKQTTSVTATTEEELRRIKDENERLRKTNKALIEKLNSFQQKIIALQLENKKLRQYGDSEKIAKDELDEKSKELEGLQKRLEEQKKVLEAKEEELNAQLARLKEIEKENIEQRKKLSNLETLYEEGAIEREIQQEQISDLMTEKNRQRNQIDHLEDKQKLGEERLWKLEERLRQLETGTQRSKRRQNMSSLSRNPWMNGIMERSHHTAVKFNPGSSKKGLFDPGLYLPNR